MGKIHWWNTSFGNEEVERLAESVANRRISHGVVTEEFEAELAKALDVPYVLATTSGSAALLLALMSVGVGRDDEVIMPDRTWVATAHAATLLGAKVSLVDVDPNIPSMDVSQVEAKITSRTKAIMPVHINGRAVDMQEIHRIAEKHGLLVIEDAAQAMFSKNSSGYLGTRSDIGCFSLSIAKIISTGQGGFLAAKDESLCEKIKLVRNHGVVDNFTDAWNQMGFNFKFTDLLSSFGLVQLQKIPERVEHCRKIYREYERALKDLPYIDVLPVDVDHGEMPLWVEALCPERKSVIEFLSTHDIQARPFPPSIHSTDYLDDGGDYPHSNKFSAQGMYLPCGPTQPLDNIERVTKVLQGYQR